MVHGIERLKEAFAGLEDQYVIIGGTACDILMAEEGLDFRATKDIDMVLIVEALTPDFGNQFWKFVQEAGYEHRNKSTGAPQFYRFSHPKDRSFPFMIELFSHRADSMPLPETAALTPLHVDDTVSSLSAILLNEAYYAFLRTGAEAIDHIPLLDAAHLIPFKAKAWLDLSSRQAQGEHVDSKNIKKHKNDVFRLSELLIPSQKVPVSSEIYEDMQLFIEKIQEESVDLKALGISGTKAEILDLFKEIYLRK